MKHRVRTRTLGRQTAHRLAMLRNMARSLLLHRRITTTHTRALELSRYVEDLITFAKKAHTSNDAHEKLAAKRQVFRRLSGAPRVKGGARQGDRPDRSVAEQLFNQIAPSFSAGGALARQGGYTRIIRLYPRKGDGAPMSLIELVEAEGSN